MVNKRSRETIDEMESFQAKQLMSTGRGDTDNGSDYLWEKIQHRVMHHLNKIEGKLMDHVEHKTSRLNQSTTINYLYKVYHYLIEEVEVGKRIGEMRAGEIEKVRKMSLEQGKEIVALESDVNGLRALVNNLTSAVHDIRAHQGVRPGQSPPEMTSPPQDIKPTFGIKPQFPVGKSRRRVYKCSAL